MAAESTSQGSIAAPPSQLEPAAPVNKPSSAWYQSWFNADYLTLYRHRGGEEAEKQTAFAARIAPPSQFPAALDVGCGAGRHLSSLLRRGYCCSGVDLSSDLLRAARSAGPGFRLVQADMRSLPFAAASFDLVLSFFTSFGYFTGEGEDLSVLKEWRRVLRPGGKAMLDYLNPLAAVTGLVAEEQFDTEIGAVEIKRWYDQSNRRIEKEIRIRPPSQSGTAQRQPGEAAEEIKTYRESVRLFSPAELIALLRQADFSTAAVFGDFNGGQFDAQSPRLILAAS